jgi:hypothetical protein
LQTTATVADPKAKFADATGRTFVGPNTESLKAAMRLATKDDKTGTWPIP